jgi:hypothetical protein
VIGDLLVLVLNFEEEVDLIEEYRCKSYAYAVCGCGCWYLNIWGWAGLG